jgi:8-oxo-dGTP pyrophosphatase MutT (NUDIX family)
MSKKVVPATAIVFKDGDKILLSQRNYVDDPENRYHGAWGFPGGGIEEGEQPLNTAIRETEEETGIKIEVLSESKYHSAYKRDGRKSSETI